MDGIVEPTAGKAARTLERRTLPVLDVGPALTGDKAAIAELAEQWREVWESVGFMCIVNHGVPAETIARMEAEAKRFHDLPLDVKMTVSVTRDQKGYTPAQASITTHSEFHDSRKLDTVECFVVATDYADDNPHVQAGEQFYGKMPWLPEEVLPGFRAAAETYMETIGALGKKLLPVWALSLDLPEDYFDAMFEDHYTYFRMAKYPPKLDLEAGEMGVNAHADTGFMTFLPPANEEGLQVLDTDGTWFWPELPAGALIVNAGQFLGRWSNDRFRATPHRVVPPLKNDRYSLACFINPNFEAVGECLPTCTGPGNPPKYPTQTYREFFTWYMTNTFTHYGKLKAVDGRAIEA
jgi:isopenicillin N synthase-like dioxygenase